MTSVLGAVAAVWISLTAVLVLVLLVSVLAAWRRPAPRAAGSTLIGSLCVLMPAHDEAGAIAATVFAVLRELPAGGRLLVVADNCSDTTAAEARAAGAEVVERHDAVLRGKGHALAFGVQHLRAAPPDVVIVLDADCIPAAGALELLAQQAMRSARPAQASYLMRARAGSALPVRMAAFAWALRNRVRPLGLHRLGLPCQLMGSGMAFPWACIASAPLGSGHLTEDRELGLRLAAQGQAARFCPQARVESWFPSDRAALASQRTRWEHGHLALVFAALPAMLLQARGAARAAFLALALDLCVPPLALLALMLVVACGCAAWLAAGPLAWLIAAWIACASAIGFVAAVAAGWWMAGREWVRFGELATAPLYVLKKLPVYAAFLFKRQKEWVRTSRQP
jgi:cellulose synthase/poly-beta-1,6-N-acetylglucosamine synthase-like glycosyltransferase